MSKLVRLTSTDNNAIFKTQFNEEILLNENSSVSLLNLSCEIDRDYLEINTTNNKITYSLGSGVGYIDQTIKLTEYTYNSNNIQDLFDDMENKLNRSLKIENGNKNIGGAWKVVKNNQNKVELTYKLLPPQSYPESLNSNLNINSKIGVINKNTGTNNSNDGYLFFDEPMSRGCGVIRFMLNDLSSFLPIDTTGVLVGLTTTKPTKTNIQNININFGIHARSKLAGTKYNIIKDNVSSNTTTNINIINPGDVNNDYLELNINGDIINANVYQNGLSTSVKLGTYNYDNNNVLYYPFIYFYDNGTESSISKLKFTADPYISTKVSEELPYELGAPPGIVNKRTTNGYLEFESELFAEYLGFDTKRKPETGTLSFKDEINYKANKIFNKLDLSDNFVVLIDNLELDSYDSSTNGRKNILMTIPQSDSSGALLYDTKYPVFINLRNKNKLGIRNINARIVNVELNEINTNGISSITLLFKD